MGYNSLACWIINLLLDVLLCSIAENFHSLFVFWLALRARQNTAQLVKILSDTTQQSIKIYIFHITGIKFTYIYNDNKK